MCVCCVYICVCVCCVCVCNSKDTEAGTAIICFKMILLHFPFGHIMLLLKSYIAFDCNIVHVCFVWCVKC